MFNSLKNYFLHLKGFIPVKRVLLNIRAYRYRGNKYHCPCCEQSFKTFLPMTAGASNRDNVVCPGCGVVERHRLLWLYLEAQTTLLTDSHQLLYLAPTDILQEKFKQYKNIFYLSADLESPLAMQHFDIMDIPIPNNSFSFIICSHILAHVKDSKKALEELYRILKPDGILLLLDDYESRPKTLEDKNVTTPEERKIAYGQSDRWRLFGKDFLNEITTCGFKITKSDFASSFPKDEIIKYRLDELEKIYTCKK